MKNKTYAQLQQENTMLQAQDIGRLSTAKRGIDKAGESLYASGCIVKITNLSGAIICDSFMIADGLSSETIKAIKADIEKTINQRLLLNGIKGH